MTSSLLSDTANHRSVRWVCSVLIAMAVGSGGVVRGQSPLDDWVSGGLVSNQYKESPEGYWGRSEMLVWWMRGQQVPPLVTASPVGTPREEAGVLGLSGTSVLSGGERVHLGELYGGRFTVGKWSDRYQESGVEASFFFLENEPFSSFHDQTIAPVLARPYFDVDPLVNAPASELVAYPGSYDGSVSVFGSNSLIGADLLFRQRLMDGYRSDGHFVWIDFVGGWRFVRLRETLGIREDIVATDPEDPFVMQGTQFEVADQFRTSNNFHGATFGIIAASIHGPFTVEGTVKLGIGANFRTVAIDGATRVTVPDYGSATYPGGLLAQPTNMGHHHDPRFAIVPEANLRLRYQLTEHVRLIAGYSLIYWTNVVRPGEQIDLSVNSSQIGGLPAIGLARPALFFHDSDFWVQGLDFGIEFRF